MGDKIGFSIAALIDIAIIGGLVMLVIGTRRNMPKKRDRILAKHNGHEYRRPAEWIRHD